MSSVLKENYVATCPVCGAFWATEGSRQGDYRTLSCTYCGDYIITDTAQKAIDDLFAANPYGSPALAHWLRLSSREGKTPTLTEAIATKIVRDTPPASPIRQSENFILWLGEEQKVPGPPVEVHSIPGTIAAGAPTFDSYNLVVRHLHSEGFIEGDQPQSSQTTEKLNLRLSFRGWQFYEELRRGTTESRVIFMAMKFGVRRLDKIFDSVFKVAVGKAGFDLIRLDQRPKAGLIDDALRVEIRRSAMLIADLTENNPGAYWEGGFAEGLGKPVLYTCEERFFRRKGRYKTKGGTHFDTNHLYTVLWREDDLATAEGELKAAVRATLPDLAKMTDG